MLCCDMLCYVMLRSVTFLLVVSKMAGRNVRYTAAYSTPDDDQDVEVRCGYGKCRPKLLENCNNSKAMLAIMSFYVFAQGFIVNGVFNVNVSTLERRFLLKSTDLGLVNASYDIAASVFGVIISYFGSGRHKARWLSISCIFMIAGSILTALPHFTTGKYEWGETISNICEEKGNSTSISPICEPSGLQRYIGLFAASMVLFGVGGATIYTVGTAFVDDSVSARHSPIYMGIFFGFAALGPSIGYTAGGYFLNTYVDFDSMDTSNLAIDSDDVRWVGAWWLGPVFCIFFFALSGLALSCFGAELPSAKIVRETRISQLHNGTCTKQEVQIPARPEVTQVPRVLLSLVKNPPFLFTTLAGITESFVISGLSTFTAKFVENAFNVSASKAGILAGGPMVVGLAGGIAFGGFFCRCLKLRVKGMLKFCFASCLISAFCSAVLFATCDQNKISGVQRTYFNSGVGEPSLIADCNSECSCTTQFYVASCDENGVQYFSPCHAGCRVSSDDEKKYENCSCIASQSGQSPVLTEGRCDTSCNLLYLFLIVLFLLSFTTLAAEVPAEQAVLRSIEENHRVIMCGANRFFIRLLGTVPGAVVYGAATDTGCLTWKKDCGEDTSCWIYDISVVTRNYFIITIVSKILSLTFFFCAFLFYKPPKIVGVEIDLNDTKEVDPKDEKLINSNFDQAE